MGKCDTFLTVVLCTPHRCRRDRIEWRPAALCIQSSGRITSMTTRKRDSMIGRRYFRNFLFFGAPFIGALLFAFHAHQHGRIDWLIAAFVVCLGTGLTGLVRQERLTRRYSCQDCGGRLENPSRRPGEPIEYLCPRCDVIWETGFFESKD